MQQDSKIIDYSVYALLIGLIFLVSYTLIRPLIFENKKIQAELTAYKSLFRQKTQTLEEFNKIAIPYKEKREQIAKVNEMVLLEADMIYTLIQFESVASQTGMVMKNISFGTLEGSADNNFGVFPVNLTVEGTYENFKNFLDLISKNSFLMDVVTVGFSATQTPGIYTFSSRVDTYTERSPNQQTDQTEISDQKDVTPTPSPTTTK